MLPQSQEDSLTVLLSMDQEAIADAANPVPTVDEVKEQAVEAPEEAQIAPKNAAKEAPAKEESTDKDESTSPR